MYPSKDTLSFGAFLLVAYILVRKGVESCGSLVRTNLVDVADGDWREEDLVQGLRGGVDGGHHGALVEVRSSGEDEEGGDHDWSTHYHHPDMSPGGATSENIPEKQGLRRLWFWYQTRQAEIEINQAETVSLELTNQFNLELANICIRLIR